MSKDYKNIIKKTKPFPSDSLLLYVLTKLSSLFQLLGIEWMLSPWLPLHVRSGEQESNPYYLPPKQVFYLVKLSP